MPIKVLYEIFYTKIFSYEFSSNKILSEEKFSNLIMSIRRIFHADFLKFIIPHFLYNISMPMLCVMTANNSD